MSSPKYLSKPSPPLLPSSRRKRDYYIQEWLLLAFASVMMLFIFFVARHDQDLEKSTISRDALVIEQSIARRLEADTSFVDRLAVDLGTFRAMSPEEFERTAGKRASDSGYITDIFRVNQLGVITRHAPLANARQDLTPSRAPIEEQKKMLETAEKTTHGLFSAPYKDSTNAYFLEYAAPVFNTDRFAGTLNALMSVEDLIDSVSPSWVSRKYRVVITAPDGRALSDVDALLAGTGFARHTTELTALKGYKLTLTVVDNDSVFPKLLLYAAVIALTALMVWTLIGLRKQQKMRVQAETDRDAAYSNSLTQLRENNERFETVLDSLDASVYVSSLQTGELLFSNSHFRETFPGISVGESALNFESIFVESPSERFPNALLLGQDGQPDQVFKDEFELRTEQRWYLTRTRAVRWVGGHLARLTTLGDVTDRILAEKARQTHQEQLTRTSKLMTVGEMASTLAHELNQPLAAIANYVSGCVRRLKSSPTPDSLVIDAMEKADKQVIRAAAIISRVRDFVRTREPQREAIDLSTLVHETTLLTAHEDEALSIRCECDFSANLPPVYADKIMIEQVLLNLLRNAREAMSHLPLDKRVVGVRTLRVDEQFAAIEVSDQGTGIPPEAAAQLFSPFFTTKVDGMGMGLNICRSLIEYHEGQLTFEDNAPVGCVFRFTLPFYVA